MSPVSVWTPVEIPSGDSPLILFGLSVWPGVSAWGSPNVPVSTYTPCIIPDSPATKCTVPVSTWTKETV